MLWNNDIVVTINGNNVLLEGRGSFMIRCLGSTAAVFGGESKAASFLIALQEEREELLAVVSNRGAWFIFIQWENGKAYVDENKNWVPFGDRLGRISSQGYIEIRSQGKIFSTDPSVNDGVFFVGDGDACCNHLLGYIDIEELISAAEETQRQISLQERYSDLEERCDNLERTNKMLSVELDLIRGANIRLIAEHKCDWDSLQDKIFGWEKAATRLRDAVKSPLIKKRYGFSRRGGGFMFETRGARIKEALRLFPDIKHYDRSLKSELIIEE